MLCLPNERKSAVSSAEVVLFVMPAVPPLFQIATTHDWWFKFKTRTGGSVSLISRNAVMGHPSEYTFAVLNLH